MKWQEVDLWPSVQWLTDLEDNRQKLQQISLHSRIIYKVYYLCLSIISVGGFLRFKQFITCWMNYEIIVKLVVTLFTLLVPSLSSFSLFVVKIIVSFSITRVTLLRRSCPLFHPPIWTSLPLQWPAPPIPDWLWVLVGIFVASHLETASTLVGSQEVFTLHVSLTCRPP